MNANKRNILGVRMAAITFLYAKAQEVPNAVIEGRTKKRKSKRINRRQKGLPGN